MNFIEIVLRRYHTAIYIALLPILKLKIGLHKKYFIWDFFNYKIWVDVFKV